jgi:DNA-binding MarR family transcriptional regulator
MAARRIRGAPPDRTTGMPDRQLAQKSSANGKAQCKPARARNGRALTPNLGVLDNHLGYFIRRVQLWVFQDFIRALAAVDIRPAQYSVLVMIAANPGFSQSDIAEALGIERARVVRLLDRLEKRGLTQRLASPTDRRSHTLRLTREGQRVLKRAKALAAQHEMRLIDRLGKDQYRLTMNSFRDVIR